MTTQYTTILKLALPVQGTLSGTWGDVVNDNITQMVEQAVAGKAVINTWTGNSHTLTTADGTTSESRCAILELTDSGTALTGAGTVVCPTNTKLYIVDNNTAQIVTVKTSGGTGVAVPVGKTMLIHTLLFKIQVVYCLIPVKSIKIKRLFGQIAGLKKGPDSR